MPGSRFKEFIDRAFLGNRGYDYQTGTWNRNGVTSGLIGGIGNTIAPGLGTIARTIYEHHHNGVGQPTQYTGGLGSYNYQPPDYTLNAPDLNIHYGTDGYTPPAWNGGNYVDQTSGQPSWQNGYGAGGGGNEFTPSTVTLNPGPGVQPIDFPLYAPDLNIKTGNGGGSLGGMSGGHSTSGGGGMYTSGTLGGGYAVDPSQWGAFGLGGSDAGDSTGFKAATSTGMGESGGGGGLASMLARRRPPYGAGTGGGGQIGG